ncbi:hypothetical protein G5714_004424 [Onychostoma macrolepis]|uniref:C-type lectin domain-containing protein n=1 Tax=Onychostoma macrolepis TaxID=369639 RepID=A0A7J6D4P8_9TELE|nr:hypothetical protein G5714_004424 [Onychostoma macrolepis]
MLPTRALLYGFKEKNKTRKQHGSTSLNRLDSCLQCSSVDEEASTSLPISSGGTTFGKASPNAGKAPMTPSDCIRDGTGRDEWHWSSGEPALYLNWEPGQPDGGDECAVMANGEWHDLTCSDNRHFICNNKEIQRRVMNVVKRASTAAVWLGLHNYCIMNMWLWLSGEIVCYQNWAPGNGTTPENCKLEKRKGAVQSGGDQRWISLPESHKLNFICSRN